LHKPNWPNLTTVTRNGVIADSYSYDPVWKDQLTAVNGAPVTFDNMGNLKTNGDYTFTWSAAAC